MAKRNILFFLLLLFSTTFSQKASAAFSPLGISLFYPIQFPFDRWDVFGLRLGLGYSKHDHVIGVDLGILNTMEKGSGVEIGVVNIVKYYSGIQLGLVNLTTDAIFLQAGLFNRAKRQTGGLQVGLFNSAKHARGLQIGLINYSEDLHGIQLGILNINVDGPLLFCPGINIGF